MRHASFLFAFFFASPISADCAAQFNSYSSNKTLDSADALIGCLSALPLAKEDEPGAALDCPIPIIGRPRPGNPLGSEASEYLASLVGSGQFSEAEWTKLYQSGIAAGIDGKKISWDAIIVSEDIAEKVDAGDWNEFSPYYKMADPNSAAIVGSQDYMKLIDSYGLGVLEFKQ